MTVPKCAKCGGVVQDTDFVADDGTGECCIPHRIGKPPTPTSPHSSAHAAAHELLGFVRRVVADAGASVCKGANGEPELCGGLDAAILLDEFYRHGRAAIARASGAPK